MKSELDPKTSTVVSVEAAGFKDGTNGVVPEHGQDQIDSRFGRLEAEVRESASERAKALEALANTLTHASKEAQERWQMLREKHGDKHPGLFTALFLLGVSFVALAAEAILLAPILDILGIADPDHQLWAAAAIVTIAAVLFHQYLEHRQELSRERLPQVLAASATVGLIVLGVLRARQLQFAADLGGGPLGEFLREHSWLGGTMFVFLTLGFPAAAALALHQGGNRIHSWWNFRQGRKKATKLAAAAEQAKKQLESQQERLEEQTQQLREQCKEWKAAYRVHHSLGVQVGAKRRPSWTVWAKATVSTVLMFVVAAVVASILEGGSLTTLGLLLSSLLAGAAWLGAAVYFHRKWEHPSPEQYLKQADLRFRDDPRRTPIAMEPAKINGPLAEVVPPQVETIRQMQAREVS